MIRRHRLRKTSHLRPGKPGRSLKGSDAILVMLAGLLVFTCIARILYG